jgi:predicted lipoprotein
MAGVTMLKKLSKILISLCLFPLLFSCTVVRHDDDQKEEGGVTFYFESEDFDAASFIKECWDARIVPEIKENAVDLNFLMVSLRRDQDETIEKHGIRKEESSPFSFIVKGNIPIKSINQESAAGLLALDTPDLRGNEYCQIQIGPVIKKSAVRDALSFINFGDFANQIEFANISREINFYIRDHVVSTLGDDVPENSSAEFFGVFILDGTGSIIITPVILIIHPGE